MASHAQSFTAGGLQQGADRGISRRTGDLSQEDGRPLWIEHDIIANAKLKKALAFYE
jgi:hypothetical protein